MTLLALAILPAIVLLVYIYKKDTVEKEPHSLLAKCFFFGALALIPIFGWEVLSEFFLASIPGVTDGSISHAFLKGFVVAALCEESFKYAVLRKTTWKNKHFDYFFDGIVYAVFVSLGFATFENILYTFFNGGASTALMRMFTAVPGHTCYGVVMGYYYGAAKHASLLGRKNDYELLKFKAVFYPILLHGFYDALIMVKPDAVGKDVAGLFYLVWIIFTLSMFSRCFRLVNLASKHDQCFYYD